MDLPVMPPVKPMLPSRSSVCPPPTRSTEGALLRAQVGREASARKSVARALVSSGLEITPR